jgi:hypothetical protein
MPYRKYVQLFSSLLLKGLHNIDRNASTVSAACAWYQFSLVRTRFHDTFLPMVGCFFPVWVPTWWPVFPMLHQPQPFLNEYKYLIIKLNYMYCFCSTAFTSVNNKFSRLLEKISENKVFTSLGKWAQGIFPIQYIACGPSWQPSMMAVHRKLF